MYKQLLAKSAKDLNNVPYEATLLGHLKATYEANEIFLDKIGSQLTQAFGLNEKYFERFSRIMKLATITHDLIKANSHFQDMIREGRSTKKQAIRHEHLAIWVLNEVKSLKLWLSQYLIEEEDWNIFLWAISCHHRKAFRDADLPLERGDISVLANHPDFEKCLNYIGSLMNLGDVPESVLKERTIRLKTNNEGKPIAVPSIVKMFRRFKKAQERVYKKMSLEAKRLSCLCRAFMVSCDVIASAVPNDLEKFIVSSLKAAPTGKDILDIIHKNLNGKSFHNFQTRAVKVKNRVVLIHVSCARGKTTAGLYRCAVRYPGLKIFYGYPTTNTATEGYRDYFFEQQFENTPYKSLLLHSRANVDLEYILQAITEVDLEADDEDAEEKRVVNSFESIESLKNCATPIFCSTPDRILTVVKNIQKGQILLPFLVNGVVVLDEIHSYDDILFTALLDFLKIVKVPTILITGTLPKARLSAIRKSLKEVGEELREITNRTKNGEKDEFPKFIYRGLLKNEEEFVNKLLEKYQEGKRILCVFNKVDKAVHYYLQKIITNSTLYHSRYRYTDRIGKHQSIMLHFQKDAKESWVGFCTQVAEMSLNISCDCLFSDVAPPYAMLQRLGRCGRWIDADYEGELAEFYFLEPPKAKELFWHPAPYTNNDIKAGKKWAFKISVNKPLTQEEIIRLWRRMDISTFEEREPSQWYHSHCEMEPARLRTTTGVSVLFPDDVEKLKADPTKDAALYAVQMPPAPLKLRPEYTKWEPFCGIRVADMSKISYSPDTGAKWIKE